MSSVNLIHKAAALANIGVFAAKNSAACQLINFKSLDVPPLPAAALARRSLLDPPLAAGSHGRCTVTVDKPAPALQLEQRPICNAQGELDVPLLKAALTNIIRRTKQRNNQNNQANRGAYTKSIFTLDSAIQELSILPGVREHTRLCGQSRPYLELPCLELMIPALDQIAALSHKEDPLLSTCSRLTAKQMKAALAIHMRKKLETRVEQEYAYLRHPGAYTTNGLSLQVPLSIGPLPVDAAGVNLSVSPGVGLSRTLGNDDEGFIQETVAGSAAVTLSMSGEITPAAKASLSLQGGIRRSRFKEYNDVRHMVASPDSWAHKKTLQKSALRKLSGDRDYRIMPVKSLRDLDRIQRDALDHGDRFSTYIGMLESDSGDKERIIVLPTDKPASVPVPADGKVTTLTGQAAVSASIGLPEAGLGLGAALDGTITHSDIAFEVRQPLWNVLREENLPGDSLAARTQAERIKHIEALAPKLNPLLEQAMARALRTQRSGLNFDVTQAERPELNQLLSFLELEFDLYCQARRQADAGVAAAAKLSHNIEGAWKAKKNPFVYLQRVALAQALIGLRLKTLAAQQTEPRPKDWQDDLETLNRLANKIYDPPMACNRKILTRHLTFMDQIPISISERQIGASLNAGWRFSSEAMSPGISGGGRVNFSVRNRSHPNPLRAGDYRDLTFSVAAGGGLHQAIDLWRNKAQGLSSRLEVNSDVWTQTAEDLAPMFCSLNLPAQGTGSLQLQFRFYRPAADPGRPSPIHDSGFHLQFVRVLGSASTAAAVYNHESARVLAEVISPNTLSYVMMRHHRFHTNNDENKGYWPDFVQTHQQSLSKLFCKLGDASSQVAREAEAYWNEISEAASADKLSALEADRERFFAEMRKYSEAPNAENFSVALKQLEAFFKAHMKYPWTRKRAEFPKPCAEFKLLEPSSSRLIRFLRHRF